MERLVCWVSETFELPRAGLGVVFVDCRTWERGTDANLAINISLDPCKTVRLATMSVQYLGT